MTQIPRLFEKPPVYPVRTEQRMEGAIERLTSGEWTRLEGAPDTEAALQTFHGGGDIWYVASGTAAIQALLLGHGIGPGDEVVTTAYTWGATVSAILSVGAVPVFADILADVPLLDPESVRAAIGPRTRAILAVHLFGFPCDMDALSAVARDAGILLFEDGSQAHGARWRDHRVGRLGDGGAFSCMALKPLAGTEGGYAVFADSAAAERAYLHGKHPRGLSPERLEVWEDACYLDALQLAMRPCAIGAELVKAGLETLETENAARRKNARLLRSLLRDLPGVDLDPEPEGAEPVYHLMSIRLDPDLISPDEALQRLQPTGLGAFRYIPTPLHRLPRMDWEAYAGPPVFWHAFLRDAGRSYTGLTLPQTEARSRETIQMGWNWIEPNPAAMEQIRQILGLLA
jgi:dTDP-4-amino-4,6-dideoxygalactose transaminase